MRSARIKPNQTALSVIALIALTFVSNGNTLGCWFIADDFVPLAYLHEYFARDPGGLVRLLGSPWQDTTTQLLYRPIAELTMILDFAIWRGNAVGWHITNLAWHTAASVSFFFLAHALAKRATSMSADSQMSPQSLSLDSPDSRSIAVWLPFFAAALFATSPLHTETVAWMIDRVDSICTTFYLLALFSFVRRHRFWLPCSLGFFALGLFSKETCVTLPVVLLVYIALFESFKISNRAASLALLWRTLPFFGCLIPYFVIRNAVLGTVIGGYVGSIGEIFRQTTASRIANCAYEKIFYPFSHVVFADDHWLIGLLRFLYAALGIAGGVRWLRAGWRQPAARLIAFSMLWTAVALTPVLSVFYLNRGLSGERFFYLPSAPIYLAMATLVIAPGQRLGIFVLSGIIAVFCWGSIQNNDVWARSGRAAQDFLKQTRQAIAALPNGRKFVLLNSPRQLNDEHQFYTADMFLAALKPPVTEPDLSGRVECLQPNTYIDIDVIPKLRLRNMIDENRFVFYTWESGALRSELLTQLRTFLRLSDPTAQLSSPSARTPDSMVHPPFHLNYDVTAVPGAAGAVLEISKPNITFLLHAKTFREKQLSPHDSQRIPLALLEGELELPLSYFPQRAVYQVRAAALDDNGRVTGSLSDPVTLDTRDHRPLQTYGP